MSPKSDSGAGRKASANLVALGSVAVLGVYAAGYARTEAAAERFAVAAQRHPTAVIARADVPANAPTPPPESAPTRAAASPAPVQESRDTKQKSNRTPVASDTQASASTTVSEASPHEDSAVAAAAAAATKTTVVASAPAPARAPAGSVPAAAAAAVAAARADSAPSKAAPPAADSATSKAVESALKWKDGAYVGWGTSRHGDIEATVEVRAGKIVSASISQCRTQYSCSWISALPPQVVTRQSADVDYVSGATQSSNAFYGAVVDALNKAK